MAAGMAGQMRALGLLPLPAGAAWSAFQRAGSSTGVVHARLDLRTFCAVNQARGAWPLLAGLQQLPQQHPQARPPGGQDLSALLTPLPDARWHATHCAPVDAAPGRRCPRPGWDMPPLPVIPRPQRS